MCWPHLCPFPVTLTLGCVELQHVTMLWDSYSFNCLAQPQVIQFVSQPSYYWGFNVPEIQKTIGWEHDAIYLEIKIQIRNSISVWNHKPSIQSWYSITTNNIMHSLLLYNTYLSPNCWFSKPIHLQGIVTKNVKTKNQNLCAAQMEICTETLVKWRRPTVENIYMR